MNSALSSLFHAPHLKHKGTTMKHREPELPEDKRIRRELERQHGDMLPGSLGALEEIQEQFQGSAPITVYWAQKYYEDQTDLSTESIDRLQSLVNDIVCSVPTAYYPRLARMVVHRSEE